MHDDLAKLHSTYAALAAVILHDPNAKISGDSVLNGKRVGEMVADMAGQIHNVAAEVNKLREQKQALTNLVAQALEIVAR